MQYNFDVRIGDKDIHCRAFTLREYKDMLQAKANGHLEELITNLLKKCTSARGLPKHQAESLIVQWWAHSLGCLNQEKIYMCECGKSQVIPITLSHISYNEEKEIIKDFGPFKVKFNYPWLFEDKNKAQMIASCIDSIITPDGDMLRVDDLTEAEIDDLHSAITTDDIEEISERLLRPQIQLAIPIACECGNHVHVITGLKEFFKFL